MPINQILYLAWIQLEWACVKRPCQAGYEMNQLMLDIRDERIRARTLGAFK